MKINVLDKSIANMIAAGEVVERPASVIKELIENSVDAGAKNITAEIKKGGMTYIRITDDGCGIASDEVETAFLRHATSKIRTAEDLDAIYTLGFRGEALASIAAVAKIDIFTKTKDEEFGTTLSIEGGEVTEKEVSGCPDGTTITVRDLFFNTPARMKFLKNDATETGYITDIINKLILSHPEVSIKLIVNGKTTVFSSGDGKLISAVRTVFGKDYQANMLELVPGDGPLKVRGYVGNSSLSRKDRRHQMFFINGRYITSKLISAALGEAYQNTMMTGRFPVAVVFLEVSGYFVDVNVHPTKSEVRFSDDKKVYQEVYWAVKNALSVKKYVPEIEIKNNTAAKIVNTEKSRTQYRAEQLDINLLRDNPVIKRENPQNEESPSPDPSAKSTPSAAPLKREETKKAELEKAATKAEEHLTEDEEIREYIANRAFFANPDSMKLKSPLDEVPCRTDELHTEAETEEVITSEKKTPVQSSSDKSASEIIFSPASVKEESAKQEGSDDEQDPSGQKITQPAKPVLKNGIDYHIIGQVFATYILVQKDSELLIIDQHAACERIYFESLLEQYREGLVRSQILMIPVTVSLDPVSFALASENLGFMESLGFECDIFGDMSIIVRSVPSMMTECEIKDTVLEIVSLLSQNKADIKKAIAEEALHTVACKRALKGNSTISSAEMDSLVQSVLTFDSINTCPHGRPIIVKMTKYELEKQFKRIV